MLWKLLRNCEDLQASENKILLFLNHIPSEFLIKSWFKKVFSQGWQKSSQKWLAVKDSVPEIQMFLDNNPSYCHEVQAHYGRYFSPSPGEQGCWITVKCCFGTLQLHFLPGMPFKLDPFLGATRKGRWPQKKEIRLAGALVPFANNKIEFCFVGLRIRREEARKKALQSVWQMPNVVVTDKKPSTSGVSLVSISLLELNFWATP